MISRAVPPAVSDVIDAIAQPSFLISPDGTVVQPNEAARTARVTFDARRNVATFGDGHEVAARRRRVRLFDETWWLAVVDEPRALVARLAPRMQQLAALVARGRSDKQIADEMGLTVASTRTYVRELYRQLSVHSRVELARMWLRAS